MHLVNNHNLHIYDHRVEKNCLMASKQAENISFNYLFVGLFVCLIPCSKMQISHSFGKKNKHEGRPISLFAV